MIDTRAMAFAGQFYPQDATTLKSDIETMLAAIPSRSLERLPKALIAPHAGYMYSGQIAAAAYHCLAGHADEFSRVVLLGPAHRVAVKGFALSSARQFESPLGLIEVDQARLTEVLAFDEANINDEAHRLEHSLEVHLPFLQIALTHFELLPIVVGDATPAQVQCLIEKYWGAESTLIVISTDLSHFHDLATANAIDERTAKAIEALRIEQIGPQQACGCRPLNGLLKLLTHENCIIERVAMGNSADSGGPSNRVVGYIAYAIY